MGLYESEVQSWAQKYEAALPAKVVQMIGMANGDLYGGPYANGERFTDEDGGNEVVYPGFTEACQIVREGLDDLGEVYIDVQCGGWQDREPEGEEDEEGNWLEPDWEDWIYLERRDAVQAVVGRELAAYVL